MKKIGFLLILCILMLLSFKQDDPKVNIDIPDKNFLNALIENGFDTDGDSIISVAEAEAVTSLSLVDLGISDMTGIEAFVNLKVLACPDNLLTSLDVSNCLKLRSLRCNNNQLTDLDISKNITLTMLKCCDNQLSKLDVSNNRYFTSLQCDGNQFTSLDVSINKTIRTLSLTEMPTLNQVCVWTMPFPPSGVEVNTSGSPNVNFTNDCSK